MRDDAIRVLIVDDDAFARELHAEYLRRIPGFAAVGERADAASAIEALVRGDRVDLVLLDVTMPDATGADVLRHARARGFRGDVIAVSGVRDADTVREMVALGCVHYLIKPFTFASFRERLEGFRDYHRRARDSAGQTTQTEVDALFSALRPSGEAVLPKGLSAGTLEQVIASVRDTGPGSAAEIGERLGLSREVGRRYLEYLADAGRAERAARYGARGRPQTEYRWQSTSGRGRVD